MARKDRLMEVYEHVRNNYPVHTKNDFAEALQYHRTYISSAMHGNERYLTDKLFTNICEVYPNVFNLDYLLTGEGTLLQEESDAPKNEEHTNDSVEMYARMLRELDDVRIELKKEIAEIRQLKNELQRAIERVNQPIK